MNFFVSIALIGFAGWVVWSVSRLRFTFIVRVIDGSPKRVHGQVPQAFLLDAGEICTRHGVRKGEIRGVRKVDRIGLAFSGDMPATCQQQLRNIWTSQVRRPKL
jgi:hypothetical protein